MFLKPKYPIDPPRQIRDFESVTALQSLYFQVRFQGLNNQKNGSQGPPTRKNNSTPKLIKNDFRAIRLLQYLLCENLDLGVPNIEISAPKSIKKSGLESSLKNEMSSFLNAKN